MHNFAGTDPLVAASNDDSRQLIVADLRSLIAQIETSMRLIEAVMGQDTGGDEPGSIDIVVLDDVTPRYAATTAALSACRAQLDLALQTLSDSEKMGRDCSQRRTRWPHLVA